MTRAKESTRGDPVFITDYGKTAYVLLSLDEY